MSLTQKPTDLVIINVDDSDFAVILMYLSEKGLVPYLNYTLTVPCFTYESAQKIVQEIHALGTSAETDIH